MSNVIQARAPGRVEFIGNHLDYNNGHVIGATVDRFVQVELTLRSDRKMRFSSGDSDVPVVLPLDKRDPLPDGAWINYPLGVWVVLQDAGLVVHRGFDFRATSTLPSGAGLSSSAALELASAYAYCEAFGADFDRKTLVQLCRKAENEFVGMPCGVLDQGVSAFGREGALVYIDCSGPTFSRVPFPDGAALWIFNTHRKHRLTASHYATRHAECRRAADRLGRYFDRDEALANFLPEEVEEARSVLPDPLVQRARHITEEQQRVLATRKALTSGDLGTVGGLMTASHASSQTLFENSTPELDFLVERLVAHPHVYGARLTGGGFGGAVLALTPQHFESDHANEIAQAYARRFDVVPTFWKTATAEGASVINQSSVSKRS